MPRHKTKLILIQTLKPSYFRPSHQTQVNADPFTEIESISISQTEIASQFRPPTPRRSELRCSHHKTKRFTARIQKTSQF